MMSVGVSMRFATWLHGLFSLCGASNARCGDWKKLPVRTSSRRPTSFDDQTWTHKVAGPSRLLDRVEQNTFWIALLCFWLLDFVSESLVSIEHNRTQTIDAHCVVKSIVLNVSQKHLALRACAMQLFDNCRVHLQFESSRFEVVQLYKQGNNWISSTSKYLQHVQSFHLVRWVNVTYLRLLSC